MYVKHIFNKIKHKFFFELNKNISFSVNQGTSSQQQNVPPQGQPTQQQLQVQQQMLQQTQLNVQGEQLLMQQRAQQQ